jgi:hypothetical protein
VQRRNNVEVLLLRKPGPRSVPDSPFTAGIPTSVARS